MPPKRPLVSALIPVYNGEEFLEGAIKNILQQNYQPLEIIIVDDGSTDETIAIASQYKEIVRYIYQPNRGPAAARNRALHIASGEVIAFLDVDDRWSLNMLDKQVGYLEENPSIDIVQGLIQEMYVGGRDEDGERIYEPRFKPYYFLSVGSAVYRKAVFDRVGRFDEDMRFNEDTDWYFRAWENDIAKIVIGEVMYYYRKHESNMTWERDAQHSGLARMFKKHRDRLRIEGETSQHPGKGYGSLVEYLGWEDKAKSRRPD